MVSQGDQSTTSSGAGAAEVAAPPGGATGVSGGPAAKLDDQALDALVQRIRAGHERDIANIKSAFDRQIGAVKAEIMGTLDQRLSSTESTRRMGEIQRLLEDPNISAEEKQRVRGALVEEQLREAQQRAVTAEQRATQSERLLGAFTKATSVLAQYGLSGQEQGLDWAQDESDPDKALVRFLESVPQALRKRAESAGQQVQKPVTASVLPTAEGERVSIPPVDRGTPQGRPAGDWQERWNKATPVEREAAKRKVRRLTSLGQTVRPEDII